MTEEFLSDQEDATRNKMLLFMLFLLPSAQPMPQRADEALLGSACVLESLGSDGTLDERKAERCVQCWPEDSLGKENPANLAAAKKCARTYLPNLHKACKLEIEQLTLGNIEEGGQVFACFSNFVNYNDKNGEVRSAVKEYLQQQRTGLSRQKRTGNLLQNFRDNVNALLQRFGRK